MRHPFFVGTPQFAVREALLGDLYGGFKALPHRTLDNMVDRTVAESDRAFGFPQTRADLESRIEELEDHVGKLAEDLNSAEEQLAVFKVNQNTVLALRF